MPIPVISVADMRSWEEATWASGIRESEVIGRVGRAIADWLLSRTHSSDSILIVAGKGHNGDDGRAAFKCLLSAERDASLLEVRNPEQAAGRLEQALSRRPSVILDCLFGIGLNRSLSMAWQSVIRRINQDGAMVVAVDVPSGLNAQTGFSMGGGVRADYTLTVGAPKAGMLTSQARPFVGYVRVLHEVGLLSNFFSASQFGEPSKRGDSGNGQNEEPACGHSLFFSQEEDFLGFPPPRRAMDHKGSFGHLAILAGSRGYHGAAVLAVCGAMRACPGLITLSTTPECYLPAAAHLQQAMVEPCGEFWQPSAKATGILVGPGLAGKDVPDRFMEQLRRLWREDERPVLVDASALDWLPQGVETAGLRGITPHAGEAARLLKCGPADVNENPVDCLWELSSQFGDCWVVLKGAHSLVGRKQGPVFFNATGTPGLAQGGSGDVLAGFLAGLLSQPRCQNDPETALRCGVWRHGEAAERLQQTRNNWTVEELPAALHL